MKFKFGILLTTLALVTSLQAKENHARYIQNCMDRDTSNKPAKQKMAECLVLLEKLGAQKGSQYVVDNYSFIWSKTEEKKALGKIATTAFLEMGYRDPNDQKGIEVATKKVVDLFNKDDWKTLNCLYIAKNAQTKCLK